MKKRAKAMELRKNAEEQVHAILTPEQQAKAKELREKHRQHADQPPATATPPAGN